MTTTSDTKQRTILVPLDALLDTHLGTVYRLSPATVDKLIDIKYNQREYNHPWDYSNDFTRKEFLDKWEKRDLNTLKSSIITRIPYLIKKTIIDSRLNKPTSTGPTKIMVKINSHPYILERGIDKGIRDIMMEILDENIEIELISIKIESVTPSYLINESITSFIVLDINEWLTLHFNELIKNPIPTIECIAPMMAEDYKNRLLNAVSAGKIDIDIVSATDPFTAAEIGLSYLIKLSFLPVEMFSFPAITKGKK